MHHHQGKMYLHLHWAPLQRNCSGERPMCNCMVWIQLMYLHWGWMHLHLHLHWGPLHRTLLGCGPNRCKFHENKRATPPSKEERRMPTSILCTHLIHLHRVWPHLQHHILLLTRYCQCVLYFWLPSGITKQVRLDGWAVLTWQRIGCCTGAETRRVPVLLVLGEQCSPGKGKGVALKLSPQARFQSDFLVSWPHMLEIGKIGQNCRKRCVSTVQM